MPCTIHGSREADLIEESNRLRDDLDEATRLLCAVLRMLSTDIDACGRAQTLDYLIRKIEGLGAWKKLHDRLDKEREAAEAEREKRKEMRKAALQKLSKAERQALGLKG